VTRTGARYMGVVSGDNALRVGAMMGDDREGEKELGERSGRGSRLLAADMPSAG